MNRRRIYCALSVALTVVCLGTACKDCGGKGGEGEYTYTTATSSLGTNWNPHTWEVNADKEILAYLTTPFVDISIKNTATKEYQWVFEMADEIVDVTAEHREDLTKYSATLPVDRQGNTLPLESVDSGYVFEFRLNESAAWENGEKIKADDYIYSMEQLLSPKMRNYRANLYVSGESAIAGGKTYYTAKEPYLDFSQTVGLYKVDDYTFRYVTQARNEYGYFLTSCTSNWLVHKDTYERGKDDSGEFTTTKYGTPGCTVSYGAYKLTSYQADKQAVFTQNENWYGFEEENGKRVSYTDFQVDGEKRRQYQTTKIVMNVMQGTAAKQAFLKGKLTFWKPEADDLSTYKTSDRLLQADETYTMSFFFNTNEQTLKNADLNKGNKYSVVLSSDKFRKALSLAIDRKDYVSATPGWRPTYALMNDVYYYNVFSDPLSIYRNTPEAMQAICNLYGVEYGENKPYPTLEEGYKSVTGYNLTQSRALMKEACDELVSKGLYKKGEEIKIAVGWAKGELTADDKQQQSKLNAYVNQAAQGSGFGKITFEAKGNIPDRYGDVPKGEYAVGYGAWGGAAFYPFRNFQVYFDPDEYEINEAGCYDPTKERLTLDVDGAQVTMTFQNWSKSMIGNGAYANADLNTKLSITAQLEEEFLGRYYRIPVAATTSCTLLSYQADYYTDDYSVMYGFGGLRLMKYSYDDKEWAAYVKSEGGTISYV